MVCAIAGILGAPLGGSITDYAVSLALPKKRSADDAGGGSGDGGSGGGSGGDDGAGEERQSAVSDGNVSDDIDSRAQLPRIGPHDADVAKLAVQTQWRTTLIEARALVICITIMILLSALLCISSVVVLYGGPTYKLPFLVLVGLYVTCSFATSAGITRSVMLVVPNNVRPFALGFLTLVLHALGDVPSPPLVASAWTAQPIALSWRYLSRLRFRSSPHGSPAQS